MGFAKFNIYSLRFIRQVQVHNTNVILLVFSNEQNSDGAGQDRAEARKYEWTSQSPGPHSWPDLGWMESWSQLKDGSH